MCPPHELHSPFKNFVMVFLAQTLQLFRNLTLASGVF
jgi:hypothetical protein